MSKKIIALFIVFIFAFLGILPVIAAVNSSAQTAAQQCRALKKSYAADVKSAKNEGEKAGLTSKQISKNTRELKKRRDDICKRATKEKKAAAKKNQNMNQNITSNAILNISSSSFANNSAIPLKNSYAENSAALNLSPQISWSLPNPRSDIKSYAILMYDTHPVANNWVHWCVTGIPASVTTLTEGASINLPTGAVNWMNSYEFLGYGGPNPPAGSGTHNYVFRVIGLNTEDNLGGILSSSASCSLSLFNGAIGGKKVIEGTYTGTYSQ